MRHLLVLWIAAGTCFGSANASPASPVPDRLRVRLLIGSGVPEGQVASASRDVTRIFGQAGIQVEWLLCPIPEMEAACADPFASYEVAVRVVKVFPKRRNSVLGVAFTGADYSRYASLCWKCVQEATGYDNRRQDAEILARVMAHEIGHLLLGTEHSLQGLMRRSVDAAACQCSPADRRFLAGESVRMREELARRAGRGINGD